jgi:hypothetical protein
MNRRNLLKSFSVLGLAPLAEQIDASPLSNSPVLNDRQYWVKTLNRIATPVLENLSRGELKKNMPVEAKGSKEVISRRRVTHLEAFGRLMTGISPWLELGEDNTEEGLLRKKFISLSQKSMKMAVDPDSPDCMNFTEGGQPLVDAAFLAHGIQKAPNILWHQLDGTTKKQLVACMKSTRVITPPYCNWLMFSAMVESFLLFAGEQADELRLDLAVRKLNEWYHGDGMYSDGPNFRLDYYNSYVMQPMLIDVLRELIKHNKKYQSIYDPVIERAKRYAVLQEKLISPEGTFPAIGRSIAYRFGAFQHLSQMSLMHQLDPHLKPAQVRSALTAVIKRMIEAPGTFDEKGWLTIGFFGHQPSMGDSYISTGSLYLCSAVFQALGLPESDPFWADAPEDWSSKKIWKGIDYPVDHSLG